MASTVIEILDPQSPMTPLQLWAAGPTAEAASEVATGLFILSASSEFTEKSSLPIINANGRVTAELAIESTVVVGLVFGSEGLPKACTAIWVDQAVEMSGVVGSLSRLVIAAFHPTLEDAEHELALADQGLAAIAAGNEQLAIDCLSAWLGHDGYECCAIWKAYQQHLAACTATMHSDWLKCLFVAGGAGVSCLGVCLKFLVPNPLTIKGCLITCGIVSAGALGVCIAKSYFDWKACVRTCNAWYLLQLASTGCYPPPPGMEPYEP